MTPSRRLSSAFSRMNQRRAASCLLLLAQAAAAAAGGVTASDVDEQLSQLSVLHGEL
tara:strand:- start:114 stop:284 length:171 start_codon:yes stop_codon:yes gene_type:complete